jgi:hypothetical protein
VIAIGLRCAAAIAVVLVTGPARMSRSEEPGPANLKTA